MKHINYFMTLVLLFFVGCMATLSVQENKNITFSPTRKIFTEADSDSLNLSPQLQGELINAGFKVADHREDAGYILTFGYSATWDVFHWIFRSFSLKVVDAYTGDIVYTVSSGNSGFEGVNSVITRTTKDMAGRLLERSKLPQIALAISETETRRIDIEETAFRELLKANIDKLSPIEGIWTDYENKYTVGIQKESEEGKYVAFILSSDIPNWKKGEIKAEFSETAYENTYSTKYYMANKSKVGTTSHIDDRGMLRIPIRAPDGKKIDSIFLKNFPKNIPVTITDDKSTQDIHIKKLPSKYDAFLECVVTITSSHGLGTGFFMKKNGLIVTNHHVIENDSTVSVILRNGRVLMGEVIDIDSKKDLALLSVKGDNYPWLALATADEGSVGTEIIAIGAPEKFGWSISKGIVSALRHDEQGIAYIQTDAAINKGNSGGPLISLKTGNVLGVNTLSVRKDIAEGLNFAVSSIEIQESFKDKILSSYP